MSKLIWGSQVTEILQAFEARKARRGESSAFIQSSVFAVESLRYLDQLDDAENNKLRYDPEDFQLIEIAHARWATGTAITSLDLCAAALGKEFCTSSKNSAFDLRDFDLTKKNRKPHLHRGNLPSVALQWVDGVLGDKRYKEIHGARNPLTHSLLLQHFFLSKPAAFTIPTTGSSFTTRELVVLSKDLAADHVKKFLMVIEKL